ncbi:MAG: L,D-transpeptidase [Candidatus Absconditabacteria bacterium]|nr:L,D-transpeptidase [Candidatus Absconditabacteria bacterium]MDD3868252.1 L,D-transpeptidase [Candidatus Absconditabacteria bacterium]MDD4714620.1 L,D-transpeptidase [Candidatus Absconditabacteria bacterium]
MKLKEIGISTMIGLGVVACGEGGKKEESYKDISPTEKIEEVQEDISSKIFGVVLSEYIQKSDSTYFTLKDLLQEIPQDKSEIIIKRPLSELVEKNSRTKGTNPLSKVKKTFGEILGYNQVDSIMKKNPQLADKNIEPTTEYTKFLGDTLSYPLIYPELKDKFPGYFNEIFEKDNFTYAQKDSLKIANTESPIKVVIMNVGSGEQALGVYRDEKLFLTTYVSVGKNGRTPTGLYEEKALFKHGWSSRYKCPLPYAVGFKKIKKKDGTRTWGYLLHDGEVNGIPLSHGCIRVPGLYQEIIYYLVDKNTFIRVADNLYHVDEKEG